MLGSEHWDNFHAFSNTQRENTHLDILLSLNKYRRASVYTLFDFFAFNVAARNEPQSDSFSVSLKQSMSSLLPIQHPHFLFLKSSSILRLQSSEIDASARIALMGAEIVS